MEAAVLHCESCGASVPSEAIRCPYCASELATMACPHCLGLVSRHARFCPRCGKGVQAAEAAAGRELCCPDCRVRLGVTRIGGVDLEVCARCGGVWVAKEAFDRLAGQREERGAVLGSLPGPGARTVAPEAAIHYRPCPECKKFMNRSNYAHVSGVILDICKDHGLWFDKDELRQVVEFIEGGGLERSRERRIQALEEERRTAAPILIPPVGSMGGEPGLGASLGLGMSLGSGSSSLGVHLLTSLLEFLR